MNKTLLGAALVMGAAVAGNATAGGIQIDPTGSGNIGSSTFLTSLGSSLGNFLANDALASAGANTTAGGTTIWAHNSVPVLGGELSIIFSIPMTSLLLPGGASPLGDVLSMAQSSAGSFSMWFDTAADASQASGLGYADGVLIASGAITVVPPLSFSNLTGGNAGPMSTNVPVDSIAGTGSATVNIDLTFANPLYVVNDVTGDPSGVDLQIANSLRLLYTGDVGNLASTAFADGAVLPYFGVDGDNNMACGGVETCDFQAQMNSTFLFKAASIPEPGTLALIGAGLGLFGGLRARRKKA